MGITDKALPNDTCSQAGQSTSTRDCKPGCYCCGAVAAACCSMRASGEASTTHLVPTLFPNLSPREWAVARGANFGRQVLLGHTSRHLRASLLTVFETYADGAFIRLLQTCFVPCSVLSRAGPHCVTTLSLSGWHATCYNRRVVQYTDTLVACIGLLPSHKCVDSLLQLLWQPHCNFKMMV